MTALADGPLGRAGRVLLADVVAVHGAGGVQVVHVKPLETFKGPDTTDVLQVFVGGPRPTAAAQRPSVPYFAAEDRGRYVLFLVRRTDGVAWRLETLFRVEGLVGAEKVKALARQAALDRIPDPDRRARETLAWLLGGLRDPGTWTRVHVARELNHLARVRPATFDEVAREKIRTAERRCRVPTQRTWLARVLATLAVPPAASRADAEPLPEAAAPGETALRRALADVQAPPERLAVYTAFLERGGERALDAVFRQLPEESAPVRLGLLDLLTAGGYRPAVARVRGLYAVEDDGEVQRRIVRTVGRLGSDEDVTWLDARRSALRVRREALFALARIRTKSALASLRRAAAQARADPGGSDDIAALVEYLLSSAFVEIERAAGRAVGEDRWR